MFNEAKSLTNLIQLLKINKTVEILRLDAVDLKEANIYEIIKYIEDYKTLVVKKTTGDVVEIALEDYKGFNFRNRLYTIKLKDKDFIII